MSIGSESNLTCRRMSAMSKEQMIAASSTVLKNGCRWCDCPPEYGPSTTLYNRFVR
jgi:transposase